MTSDVKFTIQYWRDELDAFINLERTFRAVKGLDEGERYVPRAYLFPNNFMDLIYTMNVDPKVPTLDVYKINLHGAYGYMPVDEQPKIMVVPFHAAIRDIYPSQDMIVKTVYLQPYSTQAASLVILRPIVLADAKPATIPQRSQLTSPPAASQADEGSPGSLSDSGTPTDSHPESDADKT